MSVKIYSSGALVSSGMIIENANIQSGGNNSMYISSGGTANSTTVNSRGYMYIYSGGMALNVTWTPCVGYVYAADGAYVTYTSEYSGVYFGSADKLLFHTQIMDNKIVSGSMYVMSGGVANYTTVNSSGWMFISSGGVANSTTVNYSGSMFISSGGVANSTTVNSGGVMSISSGGVANSTTVNGGYMHISSGGTATNITALAGARLGITVASNTYIQGTYNGSAFEMKNAYISGYTVNSSCYMYVSSGGVANDTTVKSGGSMYIISGGVANSTTVNHWGSMYISSGGVANSTTVNSGAKMHISYGGVANRTTVNDSGYMYISSGGVANSTRVYSWGFMYISSGGVANSTTVYYGGVMSITSGGTANSTTVNGGVYHNGYMYISSGGVANHTTVNSGGYMSISSGGVANDTTVNSSGRMYISSGGVANSTTVNYYGSMYISSGGKHKGTLQMANGAIVSAYQGSIIDFTVADRTVEDDYLINNLSLITGTPTYTITVSASQEYGTYKLAQGASSFTGSITIGDGTTSYGSITVNGEDFIYNDTTYSLEKNNGNLTLTVSQNTPPPAVAPSVFIYSSGTLTSSGTVIDGAELIGGGNNSMYISSGGTANSTTVNRFGYMYISSGGVANSTTVNSYGSMDIRSGGVANSTTVNSGGDIYISSGGTALSIKENGGFVLVADGANVTFVPNTINGITIIDRITVHKNTIANSTTVNSYGDMHIISGGVANSTTVNSRGSMYIYSGGVANSTTVNSGGVMSISSGGTALNITWTPCIGNIYVEDGAYVTYTSKYSGVYFGSNNQLLSYTQVMDNTIVSGSMYVMSGGVANSTKVNFGGYIFIEFGGIANNTEVSIDGGMYISSGGVANNTTVHLGYMYIYSGGVANSTTVYNGLMSISSGGVANDTTVSSGGSMGIWYGGKHTGSLQIANGAIVSAYEESIIDFTVADRTASDGYLINNLSMISGTPTYTITVSAEQADGTYKLAQGAGSFTGSITIGDGTVIYGSIAVNGDDVVYNDTKFSLDQVDGNLTLTIGTTKDIIPPVKPTATANITSPTNKDVVVSATFSSDSVIKEYSLDNNTWQIYTSGVVITANGSVYFRGHDAAGNVSAVTSYTVSNIDKVMPTISNISLSQGASNYTFTVTVSASDNNTAAANLTYQIKYAASQSDLNTATAVSGKSFTLADTAAVKTYYYQIGVTDEAGNTTWSDVKNTAVKDVTAPTFEIIRSTDALTNQNVILTVSAEDNASGIKSIQYSFDNNYWMSGSTVNVDSNKTVYFKVTDNAGNITEKSYEVTNIDKIAPTLNIAGNATEWTNQNIILTATASDGTIEYFANGKWNVGNSLTVSENGTYQFRVTDLAGNVTEKSVVVDKIDKVAPDKPIASADITSVTNQNVTVSATFSSDSVIKEYSLDNKTWQTYTSGVVFEQNGAVYFRGKDEAGNCSAVATYEVTNIDKIALTLDITADKTAVTNQNVTLTANGSNGTVEFFNGSEWVIGNQYTVSNNGIYKFRVTDNAGNITEKSYEVTNIDKIAPVNPTASANIISFTNKDVVVSATFSSDSVIKEYSLDNNTWQIYTSGVVMTANGSVYFRGHDAAGNISAVTSYTVSNIDKVMPTISNISLSQGASNYTFTVTVSASDNKTAAANLTYQIKYAASQSDLNTATAVSGKSFTLADTAAGKTYYYQIGVTDEAGNTTWSDVKNTAVKDVTAPTFEIIRSTDALTSQNVILTVSAEDNASGIKSIQYSFDNNYWMSGSTVNVYSNITVYFKVTDNAGNVTKKYVIVNNIDNVAPNKPVASADITSTTKQNVTVSATFSSDSVIKEYSFDNKIWQTYTSGVVFENNGKVFFRGKDEAGNYSAVTIYEVTNIDKIAPTLDITADKTAVTNQNVTLTANFSDGTVEFFNGSEWVIGNQYTVSNNGIYKFRVTDIAGNVTNANYNVTNIDNVFPVFEKGYLIQNSGSYTFYANVSASDNETAFDKFKYQIKYAETEADLLHVDAVQGKTFDLDVTAAGKNYYYQIGVTDEAGNTIWSDVKNIIVQDVDAPVFNGLPSAEVFGSRVTFSWDEAFDNIGVAGYYLTVDGEIFNVQGTSYILHGLTVGKHTFTISAYDEAGNVSASSAVESFEVKPTVFVYQSDVLSASGFSLNDFDINSGDSMHVERGGTANNITVNSGGKMVVNSDGTALEIIENGGYVRVDNGADVTFAANTLDGFTLSSGMTVHANTVADNTKVITDGKMYIYAGGIANNTFVDADGAVLVYSGGMVNKTTVEAGGYIDVLAGGILNDTIVNHNGIVVISTGGIHSGTLQLAEGTYIFAYQGSIIDFSVGTRTVDDDYMINRQSAILGTPDYRITVSADQDFGTYKLAQGAENFAGSITIGDEETEYGLITINGGIFAYNGKNYSLDKNNGNLTLTVSVDDIPPFMPEIYVDITDLTTENVTVGANFADDSVLNEYSFDGQKWFEYIDSIVFEKNGTVYFRSTDVAENTSGIAEYVVDNIVEFTGLKCGAAHLEWSKKNPGTTFVSLSDGQKIFEFATEGTSIDMFGLENGNYTWQVRSEHSKAVDGNAFEVKSSAEPQTFISESNGVTDFFVGRKNSVWYGNFNAVHNGFINGWTGTKESVSLAGKNRIADVFVGSEDANVLVLTDDANGDALFVEDIYSALGDQARFSQIDEIRAGAGDDIIDMTSQKFEYIGHGVKIYGGDGDDIIWANSEENILYGDAGNDRIVGGSDDDTIIGGIGNDSMHGGGGNDTFIFSGDFGNDVIEQLSGGSITLTFDSENVKWNELANAYTDGSNSVTINSDDCEVIVKYTSIA